MIDHQNQMRYLYPNLISMKKHHALILVLLFSLSLSACGLFLEFDNLRHSEPYDYYLFVPPSYTGDTYWTALIAVGGFGDTGRDCLRTWMDYADQNQFILICPVLPAADGGWVQAAGEAQLVSILSAVAQEYNLNSKSYLAGFSAGGQFVIGYAFSYPSFVAGVSVISTGNTYPLNLRARGISWLITVGDQDPNRMNLAADITTNFRKAGFTASYYLLEGIEHELSQQAIDLTLQHFGNVTP